MALIEIISTPEQINDLQYDGYLWMSNEAAPERHQQPREFYSELGNAKVPFPLEASWFSKDRSVSISMQYKNNTAFLIKVNWNELSDEQIMEEEFEANRLEGVSALRFTSIYAQEKDPFCDDLPVYRSVLSILRNFIEEAQS